MTRLRARSKDKNRFTKKYPFRRAPSRFVLETDESVIIEFLTLTFNNESKKSGSFDTQFTDTNYRVMMSVRDTTSSDSANVVLSIYDPETDTSKVTITSSAPFTGTVDVVVIKVGA